MAVLRERHEPRARAGQQRGGVAGRRGLGAGRRGGAVGRAAGRRDARQPGAGYGPVRGVAAVAQSLFGLRKELPLLLRVPVPIHISVRRLHMNGSYLYRPLGLH